jgi:hypothetical protein
VCGCVGHSAPAAGWAEASSLAREGDKLLIAAVFASNSDKAIAEQATFQEPAKFPLNEDRHATVAVRGLGKKGLEILLYHSIKERILGCTALVLDSGNLSRDSKGKELSSRAIRMPCASEIRAAPRSSRLGVLTR